MSDELTLETLDDALSRLGLQTQPSVALRLLTLAQDPNAQISDYCAVVEKDWALTGRIFRLANSAFFAQREPVTKLQRALVLLGLNRVRAVTLGFHLCRSLSPDASDLTRRVWAESIYRACLAASLAERVGSDVNAEAFVVGLMLDVGVPLLDRLQPERYPEVYAGAKGPAALMNAERDTFEVTHVDVAESLTKRWRFPDQLAQPIIRHHQRPKGRAKDGDEIALLNRIAYYTGAIVLDPEAASPSAERPLEGLAGELFGLSGEDIAEVVAHATDEYRGASLIFEDLAEPIAELERLQEGVHEQLLGAMDDQMAEAIWSETQAAGERFSIAGQRVELEPSAGGEVRAYLLDEEGERIIGANLRPARETVATIKRHLGMDDIADEDFRELMGFLKSLAA